jgi:hypothetical protein
MSLTWKQYLKKLIYPITDQMNVGARRVQGDYKSWVKRRPVSFSTLRPLPPIDPFIEKAALLGTNSGCLELMTSARGPPARATLHMPILPLIITSTYVMLPTFRRKLTGKSCKNHIQGKRSTLYPFATFVLSHLSPCTTCVWPTVGHVNTPAVGRQLLNMDPSFDPRAVHVGLLVY